MQSKSQIKRFKTRIGQSVTWINLWMQKYRGLGVGMKVFVGRLTDVCRKKMYGMLAKLGRKNNVDSRIFIFLILQLLKLLYICNSNRHYCNIHYYLYL